MSGVNLAKLLCVYSWYILGHVSNSEKLQSHC